MKYIKSSNSEEQSKHWDFCEKNKVPYIQLNQVSADYINIFYDVTNLSFDLNKISIQIKKLYQLYLEFFLLNENINVKNADDYYFFNFIVKKEHSDYIANHLFDYLIKNKLCQ